MKKTPRILIYVRVSSVEQEKDGLSKEAQPAKCIQKLDEVFGAGNYTHEIFFDLAKSGSLGPKPHQAVRLPRDRQGLFELIQKAKSGQYTHICAFRGDRIYRDVVGSLSLYADVMKPLGMEYIFVAEKWDPSSAGMLTSTVLATIAEFQRKQTSENVAQTLDHKRDLGYTLGTTPFGWRREQDFEKKHDRRNIVPVPSERETVIRIKDLYLSGISESGIAVLLNRERVPHKKSVGRWTGNTVHLVLVSPTHCGLIRKNKDGDLGEGIHSPDRFYDEGTFRQILDRLSRTKKRLRGVAGSQPFRLFAGLAYCGSCGKRLQSSFHNDTPSYRCLGNTYTNDGTHVYVNANQLEEVIVELLQSVSQKAEYRNMAKREIERLISGQDSKLTARAKAIRQGLEEISTKRDNLAEALSNKAIRMDHARKQFDTLDKQEEVYNVELLEIDVELDQVQSRTDLLKRAKARLDNFPHLWKSMLDHEKRESLHAIIERIDVFVDDDRKYIVVKLVTETEPQEIVLLKGAERYRPKKMDGLAALSARELAALKHVLDGANYVLIAKYFETTPSNTHCLLARAAEKVGVKSFIDAAKIAEQTIRKIESQLPLFGRYGYPRRAEKRLSVMEFQVLDLAAKGNKIENIALRTGMHIERIEALLGKGLAKTSSESARDAVKAIKANRALLPKTMENKERTA